MTSTKTVARKLPTDVVKEKDTYMKLFRTIKDALAYQKSCPMCTSLLKLKLDEHEVGMTTEIDRHGVVRTILTWSSPESKLAIDLETDEIISYTETRRMPSPIYGIGSVSPVAYIPSKSTGLTSDGQLMERLLVGCELCCQYYYVVQVIVSIDSMGEIRVTGLYLNSEFLIINEGDTTHEIRNIYSFEKTRYIKHNTSYIGAGIINLPLIPLDLKNPHKTLERVKTLVLFS